MSVSFIDEVVIEVFAGSGGNGCVSWRREKHVPNGGPAGGDGGNGGHIVMVATSQQRSLLNYKYKRKFNAQNGESGRSKNQYGAKGDSIRLEVPVGTQVYDDETGALINDFVEDGEEMTICEGGSGGWGNTRFATATRQAPDFSKPGLEGEERRLRLSLKLLADVGLLGFPNAGKSTFMSSVSAAKPKIANYPFTTLVPQLGVVQVSESKSFVLADIPGLIEGASEGQGLGIRFLKHLERVNVLLHLIEISSEWQLDDHLSEDKNDSDKEEDLYAGKSVLEKYLILRKEVEKFSPKFVKLPEVVALSKTDLLTDPQKIEEVQELERYLKEKGNKLHYMSSVSKDGLELLKQNLYLEIMKDEVVLEKKKQAFDPFD